MLPGRRFVGLVVAAGLGAVAVAAPGQALEVGQKAPDFTLGASGGKSVKLSDLLGKGPVVLYTFIGAFTGAWTQEITGLDARLADFQAMNAQLVGVSVDFVATLDAFQKQFAVKHPLLSDLRRQMLAAYGAMVTDEKSPVYRYGKRAYFILDREGTVRFVKVMDNALDLLQPEDLLKALRESGAS